MHCKNESILFCLRSFIIISVTFFFFLRQTDSLKWLKLKREQALYPRNLKGRFCWFLDGLCWPFFYQNQHHNLLKNITILSLRKLYSLWFLPCHIGSLGDFAKENSAGFSWQSNLNISVKLILRLWTDNIINWHEQLSSLWNSSAHEQGLLS